MKPESTVLTVKQLAERWQVSLSKIYEDNNAGKLPHLKANRKRFPIQAIEDLENDLDFDRTNISTPAERRLKRRVRELEELSELKDKQIAELKLNIARAQAFLTQMVYEDAKEAFQI